MHQRARRVLVAGGAGFVGSHLCRRLIGRGDAVRCLDDFSTGDARNVADLIGRPGFELVRHDVTAPFHAEVDEIYNLACPASPVHYQADPIRTLKVNVAGSINLLELARATRAKILLASTSEVYGDPTLSPQNEDYRGSVNPIGPRACYDEGKRCAETLFFDHHRQYGLNIRVARIFNTYGPNMRPDDGRAVSNFVVQALSGEPVTIYGDGRQTRSFCYVGDLIDGLTALMDAPDEIPGPVNLGNPSEMQVRWLAERVIALTGAAAGIRHAPLPVDDPTRRCPDITRARTLLDWEPRVDLEQGLRATIAHFRKALERETSRPAAAARGEGLARRDVPREPASAPG